MNAFTLQLDINSLCNADVTRTVSFINDTLCLTHIITPLELFQLLFFFQIRIIFILAHPQVEVCNYVKLHHYRFIHAGVDALNRNIDRQTGSFLNNP